MIIRQAQWLAVHLGITSSYSLNANCYYEVDSDKTILCINHNNKIESANITHDDLQISLDDLSEIKILPLVKLFLSEDRKFVIEDCS